MKLEKTLTHRQNYPNLEIIIGKLTSEDKPVSIQRLGEQNIRNIAIDNAVKYVYGERTQQVPYNYGIWFIFIFVITVVITMFYYMSN